MEFTNSSIRLKQFLLIILSFSSFLYVTYFGVNIFFGDAWEGFLERTIQPFIQGNITISELFRMHNEHRIFFPRIIIIAIGYFSNYSSLVQMLFSQLMIMGMFLLIMKKVFQQFSFTKNNFAWWVLLIPFLIFNTKQRENFLWGFQVGFLMVYVCTIISIIKLHCFTNEKRTSFQFILALLFAIIASFSSLHGLLIWFIGFVMLIFGKNKTKKGLLIWSITAISSIYLYFFDYNGHTESSDILYIIHKPHHALVYFISSLGNITGSKDMGLLFGSISIIIYLSLITKTIREKSYQKNMLWIAISLFSLGFSFLTTIGRSAFGVEQAFESRYITFMIPFLLSILILSKDLKISIKKIRIDKFYILLLVCLTIVPVFNSIIRAEKMYRQRKFGQASLIHSNGSYTLPVRFIRPNQSQTLSFLNQQKINYWSLDNKIQLQKSNTISILKNDSLIELGQQNDLLLNISLKPFETPDTLYVQFNQDGNYNDQQKITKYLPSNNKEVKLSIPGFESNGNIIIKLYSEQKLSERIKQIDVFSISYN